METTPQEKKARRDRGDGGLFRVKGSPMWYSKVHGKRESTGTRIKEEAKKILQTRMGRALFGICDPSELRQVRYEDGRAALLTEYRNKDRASLKTVKRDGKEAETVDGLKYVDAFFGGRSVVDIKRATLDAFVEQRRKDGASNAYINRNLALLHKMMELLNEQHEGRLYVPPFPRLKEPKARQGFCEPEQFGKLYKELPERLLTFVLFLYTTGCRTGEAKKLLWSQVDWTERLVRVEADQTKNDEARTIPLADEVFNRLQAVPEEKRVGLLFPVGCFRKAWQSACVRAGLGKLDESVKKNGKVVNGGYGEYSGLTPHDFRRSAVRNLRKAGIGETVAMSVSGHKTPEVFRRYNIVVDEDKTQAVRLVGSRLGKVIGSSSGQVVRFSRRRTA